MGPEMRKEYLVLSRWLDIKCSKEDGFYIRIGRVCWCSWLVSSEYYEFVKRGER